MMADNFLYLPHTRSANALPILSYFNQPPCIALADRKLAKDMVQSSQLEGIADDKDPSIQYFGEWDTIGSDGKLGDTSLPPFVISQGDTVRQTRQPEAIAMFLFTGTSVSVNGLVVQGCQPPMEFTLDFGKPTTTQEKLRFPDDCLEGSSSQHQWFLREGLTPGDHVLMIQMSDIVSQDDEYFILDYIQYTPLEATTTDTLTPTTNTTLSVVSPASSASIMNTSGTSSKTASPQTTQSTTSQHINNANTRSSVSDGTLLTTSTAIQRPAFSESGVSNSSSTTSITESQHHAPNIASGTTLNPLPSQTAQQQLSHTHSIPIGAIVGAILGTFALVLIFLFFWCKRRSGIKTTPKTRLFDTSDNIGIAIVIIIGK
ncbi:hypothetical protein C0993_011574 [Termitomyces sp. T159_Od127]|nr:hypothetical protein C0993_011574 [Termitomyces sp. T159_Od127]